MRLDRLKKVLKALPRKEAKWFFGFRDEKPFSRFASVPSWCDAAGRYFGISGSDAAHLFCPVHLGSASQIRLHNSLSGTRARIRDFISTHSKEGAK